MPLAGDLPAPAEGKALRAAPVDHKLRGLPSISVATIERVLKQYGSPAAGNGQAFYDLGVRYGIDPAYLLAFFVHESVAGTAGAAVANLSVGNIRCVQGYRCGGGYAAYDSWSQGAEHWYQLLSGPLYLGNGGCLSGHPEICGSLDTPTRIIPRYAPAADSNNEAAYVASVQSLVDNWRAAEQDSVTPALPSAAPTSDLAPNVLPLDPGRGDWVITQSNAQHWSSEGISGLDLAFAGNKDAFGSPIHATEPGIVGVMQNRGDGTGYGNGVYLLGYVDPSGVSYNTVYGHFQKLLVTRGQVVARGTVLGEMGSTGWSSGPHLHYEVWQCQLNAAEVAAGVAPGTVIRNPARCRPLDPQGFIGQLARACG